MKKYKKGIYIFIIISFTFVVLREIYCLIAYIYNIIFFRTNKFAMLKLINMEKEINILFENYKKERLKIKKWLNKTLTLGFKIKSFDNNALFAEGFLANNDFKKWVIIVHGYGCNGRLMYFVGKKFFEKGYNVLLPDLRGHGISGAKYVGMGWHDRLDIISWINLILKKEENPKIVLYGVSMGASAVLMAAGEDLPKNVKCIISDCAFTNAYDVVKHQLKNINNIKTFPILDIINIISKIKNKFSLKEASAIKQVKKCKIPLFLIHGKCDKFVPVDMVFKLYKNANCKKRLIIAKKAGHGVSSIVLKKYWAKVFDFIDSVC